MFEVQLKDCRIGMGETVYLFENNREQGGLSIDWNKPGMFPIIMNMNCYVCICSCQVQDGIMESAWEPRV